MSSIIKLNVGGQIFQTTKSTLTKFDGFFRTMLETDVPVTRDENQHVFIDRSPRHFELILNFMRDGDVALPSTSSAQEILEIQKEAQYYLLDGLVEVCSARMLEIEKSKIPAEENSAVKLRFIENEDQKLQLIADIVDKPLLIVYFDLSDRLPYDFSIQSFMSIYQYSFTIYFKSYECADDGDSSDWFYKIYDNRNGMAKWGLLEDASSDFSHYWNTCRNKLKKPKKNRRH